MPRLDLDRFKNLCKKCGIKQAALFERVNRPANYSSDLKKIKNVPLEYVAIWAEALHTTPAYLLGETDDPAPFSPKKEQPAQSGPALEALSSAEIQLLSLYRELNTEGKKKVQDFVQDLIDTGKYKKYNPSDFEINA